MNKNAKKTNGKTKTIEEIVKETKAAGGTVEDAQEAASEIYSQQPIYNIFNFFIGGPNKVGTVDSKVSGKPSQPPY